MKTSMPMLPPLMRLRPSVSPFLPGEGVDASSLSEARPGSIVDLADGDTLALEASLVRRTIRGRTYVMYAFNGQYPGPLIRVSQGAEIVVEFTNRIDLPTSVHWHGVRVENRYDGVPGVTQDPVEPGGRFIYRVRFRDAGIYWYHPHHREDIQQDLGLYGNMFVRPPATDYYGPANREEFLVLDDLLIDDAGLYPFGEEAATHTLMGRFGNVFLVNGEPDFELEAKRGEVVRFFLTNVSNTRVFNLSFEGARMKVVGADIGKFERERWVSSVVLAPAQRYVVDVRFEREGRVALTNRIQAIDHYLATFDPDAPRRRPAAHHQADDAARHPLLPTCRVERRDADDELRGLQPGGNVGAQRPGDRRREHGDRVALPGRRCRENTSAQRHTGGASDATPDAFSWPAAARVSPGWGRERQLGLEGHGAAARGGHHRYLARTLESGSVDGSLPHRRTSGSRDEDGVPSGLIDANRGGR
ncbi:MAG: multicopper oxidase domain-containing protein [Gemmatimonadales bacterium]